MLNSGDIALIGLKADNPDDFSFVALTDIPAGEVIYFTDNGVHSDGNFRSNEGTLSWTAPAGGIAAGSVVSYLDNPDFATAGGSFAFSTGGDQLIAYQDNEGTPHFLYALTTHSDSFDADATSWNTTALPTGLVLGETAVAVGPSTGNEYDNAYNSGPLTGTPDALRVAIADPANWTGVNDAGDYVAPTGDFTIEDTTAATDLRITEIMFNPSSPEDDWEWVEIYNAGSSTVDLSGWVIDDGNNVAHNAANIASGSIAAGESAILYNADDISAEDFAAAWGQGINLIPVTNWNAMALNNGGDSVALWDSFEAYEGDHADHANAHDQAVYAGDNDDGAGSVYLADINADNSNPDNWELSTDGGTTPVGDSYTSSPEGGNSGADVGSPESSGNGLGVPAAPAPEGAMTLTATVLSTTQMNGSEIVAYDKLGQRAFVTSANGVQVLDISDPANPVPLDGLLPADQGYSNEVTSVAVFGMLVAVAVPSSTKTDNGNVLFYDTDGNFLGAVEVGPNPDMLTFDETGVYVLVANEGESSGDDNEPDAAINPDGSVSIISVNGSDLSASTVNTVGFTGLNGMAETLRDKGVRLNPDAPSVSADMEPEYIAIIGNTAYVSLQENNAYAIIDDITTATDFGVDDIVSAGTVDHSIFGNGIDSSDRDDGINILTRNVTGLRMPDAITAFTIGGVTYFASANEGDDRDVDAERAKDLTIDPDQGDLVAAAADDAELGRLNVSTIDGDTDGDGDYDALYSFGTRSFTIYDEDGNVVFDSGDLIERIVAEEIPDLFNSDENDPDEFDARSDNKGPEPEAVTFGEIDGTPYLFVGLERAGGVMVFDVTDPANPVYDQYIRVDADIAPEGLAFIAAEDSPTGKPILAVANEVSETLSLIEIAKPAPDYTLISEIQGSSDYGLLSGIPQVGIDDISPMFGQTVTIQAVITAEFLDQMSGFYVQEEEADYDDDAYTSEGVFIFAGALAGLDIAVGDLVTITGTVGEYFGQTQITADLVDVDASGLDLPMATEVMFPTTGIMRDAGGSYIPDLEFAEGMIITVPTEMTITEMYNLDRFGQYTVSSDGRLEQFTQNNAPSVEGYEQHLQDIAARSLVLDDGRSEQNPDTISIIDGNNGVLDADDSFRMGDTITNVTGVVNYSFDEFRIQNGTGDYSQDNPRPETPEEIGGNFKVASLNVLNYFTTLDTGGNNAGPDNDMDPRGANSPEEFERQYTKLVNAIVEMDADVLGLMEIENDDDIALADLVARVNAALGDDIYGYVATGDLGGDAITQAFIYKLGTTELVGDYAALYEHDGQNFLDPLGAGRELNRPALAQTFKHVESGEEITVAVNHLKSKGSLSGLAEDEDQLDGQGNNNASRAAAADILADWLDSDPTGTGAGNVLIIGDLNSYAMEDPITVLAEAGYTDLAKLVLGDDALSYVFDGQTGTLDYALANEALLDNLVGVTEWHINADEADALDYNLDFGRDPSLFNGDSASRNSDHDPVIVSFNFEKALNLIAGTSGNDNLFGTDEADLFVTGGGTMDIVRGFEGLDSFDFSGLQGNGTRDMVRVLDFEEGETIFGLTQDDITNTRLAGPNLMLQLAEDRDLIVLSGIDSLDDIVFADEFLLS